MERKDVRNGDNTITTPELGYMPHPGGLGCTIFEKMWEHHDKLAQINGLTGEEETYNSLLKRCIRVATAMRSKGVTQDDIITLCSATTMDACVPYIATLFLGAIPTSLDPTFNVHDVVHLLGQVKPKMVFVSTEALEVVEKAVLDIFRNSEIVVFGETTTHTHFSDFLLPHPDEDDFKPVPTQSLKETAVILFSSGTSGLPKGICLSHLALLTSCHQTGNLIPMTRVLTFASLNWISTVDILVGSIMYGYCRVVVPKVDLSGFWKLLETAKPTLLFLAPSFAVTLIKMGRPATIKRLPLKMILMSGAPISEKHMRGLQKLIPEATVMLGYAQTELTGPGIFFKAHIPQEMTLLAKNPISSGTVLPGFSFRIVNPETEEILGPNERGELRAKSICVMNGYYNMDSSSAWDSNGWLKTGDIAYYDEDRCFYIVDRIKEQLKYRSFYVAPAALELVIMQHPAVDAAVVVGIPHEEDGDHPMALVVLSKGVNGVTPKEIEKFVEARVNDNQKLRAGVKFIEKIPVTNTGKVKRKELRDKVLQGEI